MIDPFFRAIRRRGRVLLLWAWLGAGAMAGRSVAAPAADAPAAGVATRPAEAAAQPKLDELVYADGDRVGGHFVKQEGDTIVFQSEHFGLLRVPAAGVTVILAKPPPPAIAAKGTGPGKEEVWTWPFSPLALARSLKNIFGLWHGKFALSAEMLTDTAEHNTTAVQAQLNRKWKHDEVKINARYDFASADHVTSTDTLRADASWRHDFTNQLFSIYQPTVEWNRAFFESTTPPLPADYVLLQQEIGTGITLLDKPTRQLRTGVSENVFSVWTTPEVTRSQDTHTSESAFIEAEAKLPWRISVTDRGIYYYSIARNTQGWENHFEVDKKLTETLTVGVQQEVRTNEPGLRVADYRRLKFLFGLDF